MQQPDVESYLDHPSTTCRGSNGSSDGPARVRLHTQNEDSTFPAFFCSIFGARELPAPFTCASPSTMKLLAALPLVVGVVSLAAACSSSPPRTIFDDGTGEGGVVTGDGGSTTDGTTKFEFDGNLPDSAVKDECKKMDVVFVVDDSGSMGPKQEKLQTNFPRFVDVLDKFKTKSGGDLDYRLAVTSTDTFRADFKTGGKGGFVTTPKTTCAPGPNRSWLERTDPNVASVFTCRAGLGTTGSANEKPLDALLLAVTDRQADQNRDFLRDDALLAFVILTDEEDSSATTPAALIQKLDQVKKVRGRWAGAVISGPKSTACDGGSFSGGDAAPRLHEFVDKSVDTATNKNNVIWRTICQPSFDTAVKDALDTFTVACLNLPPLPK